MKDCIVSIMEKCSSEKTRTMTSVTNSESEVMAIRRRESRMELTEDGRIKPYVSFDGYFQLSGETPPTVDKNAMRRWIVFVVFILATIFLVSQLRTVGESGKVSLKTCEKFDFDEIWKLPEKWFQNDRLYLEKDQPQVMLTLEAMRCAKILAADVAKFGTQFKILLTLEGGQKALFKPMWYPVDHVITEGIIHGKDRHRGEIFALYLDLLFGFAKVPLVTGIFLDFNHLLSKGSERLRRTVFNNGSETCVIGECYYCKKEDAFCFPADKPVVEGALVLWLPEKIKLQHLRNPWARKYAKGKMAKWQYDPNFCQKNVLRREFFQGFGRAHEHPMFLDMMDTAVFDYLMLNGDRHTYELMALPAPKNGSILLLDNGKSFGNPGWNGYDVLAPLHQCCYLRKSTWIKLEPFVEHDLLLSKKLKQMSVADPVNPLLSEAQWEALDVRLKRLKDILEQSTSFAGHDNVSVLIFNTTREKLVFVRQFNPSAYVSSLPEDEIGVGNCVSVEKYPANTGFTVELCAGIVDKNLSLEAIAAEECGHAVDPRKLEKIVSIIGRPGLAGSSQNIFHVEVQLG
ncbi:unnamed protein product [Notodromas monacha]|uniref:FAM20 C-terminal domain-containing protein n=1 Tax=Notodromas monacha TaxID=399045 RepID=A0A7R9BFI6_9CRUS|nr:unnamed protein product [Notodromas monacha]CAG0914473.1 unnamed protein product [Notodromas monacha]